jgi:glyceraldehyde-3-phosphate dehydrogenase (NADP+)
LIDDAINKGASVINEKEDSTLLTTYSSSFISCKQGNEVYHEEQFGPVVPIIPFKEIQEPLNDMAESNYGQQVSLFGKILKPLHHLLIC